MIFERNTSRAVTHSHLQDAAHAWRGTSLPDQVRCVMQTAADDRQVPWKKSVAFVTVIAEATGAPKVQAGPTNHPVRAL